MKKQILLASVLFSILSLNAQEIGYNIGLSRQGINPEGFQPLYGMSIGGRFSKYFSLETNLIYSQRTIGSVTQADYFSFILMPKIGYFTERMGVYIGPSLSLNPCLYHSNTKNHTYLSTYNTVGLQINLGKKLIVDAKLGYDIGLSGAYYENGQWQKYKGPMLMFGMKLNMGPLRNSNRN